MEESFGNCLGLVVCPSFPMLYYDSLNVENIFTGLLLDSCPMVSKKKLIDQKSVKFKGRERLSW